MKITFLFTLLFLSTVAFSQNTKMEKALLPHIAILDTSMSESLIQTSANTIERISNAEPKEWLPKYYMSLAQARMGVLLMQTNKDKADVYFKKAEEIALQVDEMSADNSEVKTLLAMIYGLEIGIDPMTRGQKLGMLSMTTMAKALEIDGTNPRALLIKGQQLLYTPEQWGGGIDKGLTMMNKANESFATFVPKSSIHPNWGKDLCKQMLEMGNKMKEGKTKE